VCIFLVHDSFILIDSFIRYSTYLEFSDAESSLHENLKWWRFRVHVKCLGCRHKQHDVHSRCGADCSFQQDDAHKYGKEIAAIRSSCCVLYCIASYRIVSYPPRIRYCILVVARQLASDTTELLVSKKKKKFVKHRDRE